MRIQNNNPVSTLRNGKVKTNSSEGGGDFSVESEQSTDSGPQTVALSNVAGLDALLSLQTVEDATTGKRRSATRGLDLLDHLDEMRVGLLGGRLSGAQIDQIAHKIRVLGRTGDEQLDAILIDIDMRARVELAKLGVYDV